MTFSKIHECSVDKKPGINRIDNNMNSLDNFQT